MATGDQADFVRRIKNELPSPWFPVTGATDAASATPILDGLLNGIAAGWAFCHKLLHYVKLQTRIATATDVFLDLCSRDYLGNALPRNANESDASFRVRIKAAILQPKATRPAMVQALTNLTGRTPWIFEPANPSDTGGYGNSGMTQGTALAYGTAGGYGSLSCLIRRSSLLTGRPTSASRTSPATADRSAATASVRSNTPACLRKRRKSPTPRSSPRWRVLSQPRRSCGRASPISEALWTA